MLKEQHLCPGDPFHTLLLIAVEQLIMRSASLSPELPTCTYLSLLDTGSLTCNLISAHPESPFLPQCSCSCYFPTPANGTLMHLIKPADTWCHPRVLLWPPLPPTRHPSRADSTSPCVSHYLLSHPFLFGIGPWYHTLSPPPLATLQLLDVPAHNSYLHTSLSLFSLSPFSELHFPSNSLTFY